jgi:hypothetical protein
MISSDPWDVIILGSGVAAWPRRSQPTNSACGRSFSKRPAGSEEAWIADASARFSWYRFAKTGRCLASSTSTARKSDRFPISRSRYCRISPHRRVIAMENARLLGELRRRTERALELVGHADERLPHEIQRLRAPGMGKAVVDPNSHHILGL